MSKYFIVKNKIKQGPLSFEELKKIKINKTDLVWKEGNDDWIKAGKMEELAEFIVQDIPQTPFEKKSGETKKSLKANFSIPIIIGLIMGFIALASWSGVKSDAYSGQTTFERPTFSSGSDVYIKRNKLVDKYLNGAAGYDINRDNENYYYNVTESDVLRPIKAIFIMFDSNTQFYAGRKESAPFISFLFLWVIYCVIIYLIIYGISIAVQRTKN